MAKIVKFKENDTYIDSSNIVVGKAKLKEYIDGTWVNITSSVQDKGVISDLEIYKAEAKKSGGITVLSMVLQTSTGLPTTDINYLCKIPDEYAPKINFVSFCRTNKNYGYPTWNGNENIAFLLIDTKGNITVRTKNPGEKVIVISVAY